MSPSRSVSDRLNRLAAGVLARGSELGNHSVAISRGLPAPMSDGVELLGDLYLPADVPPGAPTIVMRSPYGRKGPLALGSAFVYATHGFPTFIQSCRGTADSGGTFSPQVHEQSDGIDTLRWVRRQPWFSGHLATAGMSYLGYVQWAVAGRLAVTEPETAPEAMGLFVTMPDFGAITWDRGTLSMRNALGWSKMMSRMGSRMAPVGMFLPDRKLKAAFDHVPVGEGDTVASGSPIDWYQDWVRHEDLRDEFWTQQSHTASVKDVKVPIDMVSGWYDIFAPWQLANYATLVANGNQPRLTIGPWGHTSRGLAPEVNNGAVAFLNEVFLGAPSSRIRPVRIFVTGEETWHELESWPPPGVAAQTWHLQPNGGLAENPSTASGVTEYVYDAAHPTPALGGPDVSITTDSGPVDNTAHESRHDVVTFTSAILTEDLDVAGTPVADLWIGSDRASIDVFVRITDVHPDGKSMTVCDAIRRIGSPATAPTDPVRDAEGVWRVAVELWPTGHRFLAGNRIRVQISSGAHPRYARNSGTGAWSADDTEMLVAHQRILHDAEHPSGVQLPVWTRA
jgi:uncharacterized protein